jgi:hypothetical protein
MHKKYILIILGVLVAFFIIMFSFYWPPVDENDVSGAFTKADRYRESTIGDEHIVLRSDLLNDTSVVKKTIYDLVEFGDFALYLKGMIVEWWIPVLETYNQSPTISSSVAELRDFSDFITNNTNTIQNTIVTLAGFYSGDTKEVNSDVESQLKQFYNYANQFLIRDSIFEATIAKIDISIKNDKMRKKELDGLKALRDRIVVDNFIYAVSTGDTSKLLYSASQVMNNPDFIKGIDAQEIIKLISTGYSCFQTIYRKHPMRETVIKKYNGIATSLKLHGYTTAYFTTHDGQFDNVEGFLRHNDFDYVITEHDFPGHEVKTNLGVPDDVMFRYSISNLDLMYKRGKPFFATFMTSSDHGPYYIPEYFHPKSKEIKLQSVEYADWSLKQLIKLASEQEWFDNTLFVFVADHGAPIRADYDISLDYHHTPLLFYSPKHITNHTSYAQLGSQIDVFPTLMGLLKLPYLNNTLGIDLFAEQRPFTILNNDDKIGVINQEYLLILKKDIRALFKYRMNDKRNCCEEESQLADEMEQYARSQLQTYQYMLNTNKLHLKP